MQLIVLVVPQPVARCHELYVNNPATHVASVSCTRLMLEKHDFILKTIKKEKCLTSQSIDFIIFHLLPVLCGRRQIIKYL